MSEDQSKFEELRRLMLVKRHEVPPPGYFNNFSAQIIAGIRSQESAGRSGAAAAADPGESWLSRFLQLFEFKPAFAGALASALCLVLVFGLVYADRPDSGQQSLLQSSDLAPSTYAAITPAAVTSASYVPGMISSNNSAMSLEPVSAMFNSGNSLVQPVSFSPAAN